MGRPKLPDGELSVPIRLPQRVIELVDAHITDHWVRREQYFGFANQAPTKHEVAAARRKLICQLVEDKLSFDAQHPETVKVVAPMAAVIGGEFGDRSEEIKAASKWMHEQEKRLTREAPAIVKAGIEHNRLERLKRSDPDAFRRAVRDIVGRASAK